LPSIFIPLKEVGQLNPENPEKFILAEEKWGKESRAVAEAQQSSPLPFKTLLYLP